MYLSQAVGTAEDVVKDSLRRLTEAHHALQHKSMVDGIERTYRPLVEDGLQLPDEGTLVQITCAEMIAETRDAMVRLFDAIAARDFTNGPGDSGAVADVKVGGTVLIKKAPVPYILWVLGQLDNIATFVKKLPVQDAGTRWTLVDERGVYEAPPTTSFRTEKVTKSLVHFMPTDKHPGQAETYNETINVGEWTTVKFTGAIPRGERANILRRIETLREALDAAKNEANRVEALDPKPGRTVLDYIFTPPAA